MGIYQDVLNPEPSPLKLAANDDLPGFQAIDPKPSMF